MKEILMSIHHKWAELIYSGEKTLELRKTAPKALDGDGLKVYLYDTGLKSITGVIYVNFCHEATARSSARRKVRARARNAGNRSC